MNQLPKTFIERMKGVLGTEADAFFEALQTPAPVSIRVNPAKPYPLEPLLPHNAGKGVEWCPEGLYLEQRPIFTLDPGLHGGAYYVQEASSMFLRHILQQIKPVTPVRVLDLCAAPGGKSTLAASMLTEEDLLVSNEVIKTRAGILRENIIKWGSGQTVVTNNDPADFEALTDSFDIIIADVPCSGEGMFRKDPASIAEWSESNLRLCAERQQRILNDIWHCLKPGGFLVYSTCTYNPEENERMLEWLVKEKDAAPVAIHHAFHSITPGDSPIPCYRFYPHKAKGEGFFTGVLQKGDAPQHPYKAKKSGKSPAIKLPAELGEYITDAERYVPYAQENTIGILPARHAEFIRLLDKELRVIYQGCELAEINNRKLKLLPPLALWQGVNRTACDLYEADRETALTYLKKEDIPLPARPGNWLLVCHAGVALGWCKHLGNRLNNYYPKEWRIRMQLKTE